MVLCVYNVLLCLSCFGISLGFMCYTCDYDSKSNTNEGWNRRECIDDPGILDHISCNESHYCVFQETYSTEQNILTNYFRSCSAASIGNKCVKEWKQVTCRGSCQGDYCNNDERGNRTTSFLSSHACRLSLHLSCVVIYLLMFVFNVLF